MLIRIITIICLLPSLSYATLGEAITSVDIDSRALSSNTSKTVYSLPKDNINYQTFLIQTIDNIKIKEFVANSTVFAISWSGTSYPKISQLLGKYYPQIKTAKQSHTTLTNRQLNGNDFTLYMSGVPSMLYGIAYVPSLVPSNVDLRNLK